MKNKLSNKNGVQNTNQQHTISKVHKMRLVLLMCILIMTLFACKDKTEVAPDTTSTSDSIESSESDASTKDTIESTEDLDSIEQSEQSVNESVESQPFTFQDLSHNIYVGTIGEENVIMDIWPNKEISSLDISFIGDSHTEDKIYTCGLSDEYQVMYQDDYLNITLYETEDGVLTGSFTEGTQAAKTISLNLSHISGTHDPNLRYVVGTNEEIEVYAAEIMNVIKNDDIESLSKMIQYPVYIHIEEGATADNAEDLIAMSAQAVITPELKAAMAATFPRFMFSNDEGIMLGSGEYNIWLNKFEDGLKITGINN